MKRFENPLVGGSRLRRGGTPPPLRLPFRGNGKGGIVEEAKHDQLVVLAWRYAAIIGIVDYEDLDIPVEEIEADRKRWVHLIRTEDGLPCFDDMEAATYMAELSGATIEECHAVLLEVWGDETGNRGVS